MSLNTYQQTLITSQVDGAALGNSSSATSLLPAQAKYTLPTNLLNYIGQTIKVTASGRISTLVTTPGTLALDVRFGATAVMAGGLMTLNVVAKTNVGWFSEFVGTLRAVGSAANLMWVGNFNSEAVIGAAAPTAGGIGTHILPYNAAPAVGSNFDSTATQIVDLFGTWSTANASNTITCHMFKVELLN